jgi:cell division septum initiation protein DivIVA
MGEEHNRQILELETYLSICRQREARLRAAIRSRTADPSVKAKAEKELPGILKSIEATEAELLQLKAAS